MLLEEVLVLVEADRQEVKQVSEEKAGMRIRLPKTGSGSLYLKLREIFKSLLNEYAR